MAQPLHLFRVNGLRVLSAAGILTVGAIAFAQQQERAEPPPAERQAPAQEERQVRVFLVGGQRIDGVLVEERDDAIIVRISGVDTTIAREHIDRITVERPAIDRYREMRRLIADDDIDRRLILIDWMRAENLLDEARLEIEQVLEREPANGDALRLSRLIDEQISLRDRREADGAPLIPPRTPARAMRRPPAADFPLVSDADANLIKLLEVNLADPPRMVIERETVDKLITGYRGRAGIPRREAEDQAFRRLPAGEILRAMFEVRARDLYPEVEVIDLPESLRLFRDHVNSTWLVNGCATTACHGGLDAGDFLLFNRAPTSDRSFLTNLLILERYRTSDGRALIDYVRPEQSLLLQLAITPKLSSSPHPDVPGYRPVFLSSRSRRYAQTVGWIESMHLPRPAYPVEYRPPAPADFVDPADADPGRTGEPGDR
ncbi:MAG: hypothetical protein ACF8QF_12460 [Phycisphaerales bacterium]